MTDWRKQAHLEGVIEENKSIHAFYADMKDELRKAKAENDSLVRKVKKLQGQLLAKDRDIAQLESGLIDD